MKIVVNKTGIIDVDQIRKKLEEEGYTNIYTWSDSPGTIYNMHSHYDSEVRWVFNGAITIGHDEGSTILSPGDKIEIEAGTRHWSKTGEGVSYICGSK